MIEEIAIYNQHVMAGRPGTKAAPLFGQRFSALRKARGLTQRELPQPSAPPVRWSPTTNVALLI